LEAKEALFKPKNKINTASYHYSKPIRRCKVVIF